MHRAVATSLVIIALKSFSGFYKYLDVLAAQNLSIDWGVIGLVTALGVAGSFAGNHLGTHVPQAALQRGEKRELYDARNELSNPGTQIGTRHPRHTEQQYVTPVNEAGAQMRKRANERNATDNGEGAGDCYLFVLTEQVDQHRNCENRATRAEKTQANADRDGARPAEYGSDHLRTSSDKQRPVMLLSPAVFWWVVHNRYLLGLR